MIRIDMTEVLAIEHASFEFPRCEEDFLRVLRQRNCIGMVAENHERIVGFMLYEMHRDRLDVLDFAVHPEFRRRTVGTQLAAKLIRKLSAHRRTRLTLNVRETNVGGCRFFRSRGFLATGLVRGHYADTGEDAIAMSYDLAVCDVRDDGPYRMPPKYDDNSKGYGK